MVSCTILVLGGLFWCVNAHAFDVAVTNLTGGQISAFTYLINEDNAGNPSDPPDTHPSVAPMASHSPVVAAGRETTAGNITLPAGRYLISVRAEGYKLWGRHIRIDATGALFDANDTPLGNTVSVALRPGNLPLSKLQVQVFEDHRVPNGFPDFPFEVNGTGSTTNMANFHIILDDGTAQVTVDWYGNPICGTGRCLTNAQGKVTVLNLAHGKYGMTAVPPTGKGWVQTTTIEGTKVVDAWLEEGSDGLGVVGDLVREPGVPTAHYFGFVSSTGRNTLPTTGSGTITGTVRNLVDGQPTFGEPVVRPWIVVTNLASDTQVKVVRGNANGTFTISGVPAGSYQLMFFDEFLYYINAFYTVQVVDGQTVSPGIDPACITPAVTCNVGLARWFGWLSGYVFLDTNGNSIRDAGERGIANVEVRGAFRDGSHYKGTVTNSSGFYELPRLLGPLGKMFTAEVGFTNFGITGHSMHSEQFAKYNQRDPFPVVVDDGLGGGLILSQAVQQGQRSIVDWGKVPYTGTQNGGISGRVLYAITRNEYDARNALAEDYEPGIPNVTIRLLGLGADAQPNTDDDVCLGEVQSDAWQMPRLDNPDNPVSCDVLDDEGEQLQDAASLLIAERCLEVVTLGNETKPGAYDGGWAIGSMCPPASAPRASDPSCTCPVAELPLLLPGTYVVQVVPPPHYQILKEEDNNTAEGNPLVPAIPPPPCVGDAHIVPPLPDFPDFPFTGLPKPLCDQRLVTLQARQNAGLDIFLFTTDTPYVVGPNPNTSSWTSLQAVPPPGRFFGWVTNDLGLATDPASILFLEKPGVPNVPIGIYEFGGTGNAVGRRLTTVFTDALGFYEVLLPSTATTDTPIPGGVSPAMYVLVVNDPGDPTSPNPGVNGAFLSTPYVRDIWPGKMTPADTPLIPINTLLCELPLDAPSLLHVSTPVVATRPANLTITGTRFGDALFAQPTVTLGGTPLTVVTWTPAAPAGPEEPLNVGADVVVVTVPEGFPVGPAQLLITNPAGQVSRNGLTIHVLGTGYNPTVRSVAPGATIQAAINGAPVDSLIVVAPGTYNENVIFHRRVKLQGHGPGGALGIGNATRVALVPGTVIDGRFFQFSAGQRAAWQATLAAPSPQGATPFGGPSTVPAGAGITVVAATTEFGSETPGALPATQAPRIDGLGIRSSRGAAGGGIYVHAFGRNLVISNNVLESNSGTHGGGISLGQPRAQGGPLDNQNDNIYMHHNRILSSGGLFFAGSVGIFNGADNYRFANNDVCGGYSAEYGGCFSHWGKSNSSTAVAKISDNRFYYCDAFDEGGGLMIGGDPSTTAAPLGQGSGQVDIDRNLIQGNLTQDDGGGIRLLRTLTDRVNIRNNFVVNNVAADHGGGIALDDAANVVIVNNTVAGNVSTHTAVDSILGEAHGAGITSTPYSTQFLALPPGDGSTFPDPVMFNNIIFDNLAYRWDPVVTGPVGLVVPTAYIDLEVFGGAAGACLTVHYSFLSGPISAPCTAGTGNIVANGEDPGALPLPTPPVPAPAFVLPVTAGQVNILVAPGRFNPAELILVWERKQTELVGISNFHLQNGSQAIDSGRSSLLGVTTPTSWPSGVLAPTNDFDSGDVVVRPSGADFDMGADEVLP